MPDTPAPAFPRAALLVAADVPQETIRRFRRWLGDGGVCLGKAEDVADGSLPADTPVLALFRHPGALLLGRLAGLASRPGSRLIGVAIAGAPTLPGQDPVEETWRNAGLRPEDLLLWDGTTAPVLLLARLLAVAKPTMGRAQRGAGSVDVVLRTGRVLRIHPSLPPDLLRSLVEALEG